MKAKHGFRCLLALAMVAAVVGCASAGRGPSDEEQIAMMVADVLDALQGKDVDRMVSFYADDFTSDNGDREATKAFLQGAAEQGFLDGIEVDTTTMEIAVDGDTATVGPVGLEGAFGALSLRFDLEKRDGAWTVVSQSQQM